MSALPFKTVENFSFVEVANSKERSAFIDGLYLQFLTSEQMHNNVDNKRKFIHLGGIWRRWFSS